MPVEVDVKQVVKALEKYTGGQLTDENGELMEAEDFAEEVLTFFAPNRHPSYAGPIIPLRTAKAQKTETTIDLFGNVSEKKTTIYETRYYHVEPHLYDTLQGLDVYRLPRALGLLGWAKRTTTLGATALSPRWGLVLNPTVDFQTLWLNTQSQAGFARMFTEWLSMGLKAAVRHVTFGNQGKALTDPALEFMYNAGLHVAPYLYADAQNASQAARRLGQTTARRIVSPSNFVEFTKGLLSFPEMGARAVEVKLLAKERGYDLSKLTPDQAIELANAGKQVTIDFTASGSISRVLNQVAPFFNVPFQSQRATFRAAKRHPGRFALKGLLSMTVPSLLLWWYYKDDERWQELPPHEKFGWTTIPHPTKEGEYIRLRMGSEAALFFTGFFTAMADAAYREDPKTMGQFMQVLVENLTPNPLPVPANIAAEQLNNRQFYTDTPIEPKSMQDQFPHERYNEFTSRAAVYIGSLAKDLNLPEWMQSPRRIDHMMNGVFPSIDSFLPASGAAPGVEREGEAADVPVLGALIKRGGLRGNMPTVIEDLYAASLQATYRKNAKTNTESDQDGQMRLMLQDATKAVSALTWLRGRTYSEKLRRELTEQAARIARDAMNLVTHGQYDRGPFHARANMTEDLKRAALDQIKSREQGQRDQFQTIGLELLRGIK